LKVYKFYKNDCVPCYALQRILNHINIPKDIEIINMNINLEENKELAKENEINKVPSLMFENGIKLVGLKTEEETLNFLKGETLLV
jgi:glutaredoxin